MIAPRSGSPALAAARSAALTSARCRRNRFIEEWIGRENELRRHRAEVSAALRAAAKAGDPDRGAIMLGQTAGLIDRVEPAADLVRQISRDAEAILRERLPRLLA